MNIVEIKDLEPGDVLLFSAEEGSFISWAITFLTNAPVSHAAMYYNKEDQTIIEETPPQVSVNNAVSRFEGREIYVRRLNANEELSLSPVIERAAYYLNEEEPYDDTGLYMVGFLLLYKKITPNTFVNRVIIKILKKLTASIMEYINNHNKSGKLPMVCSQFVAQCYSDAGDDYRLKIKNGTLLNNPAREENGFSVLDQVMATIENEKSTKYTSIHAPNFKMQNGDGISSTGEELCKELQEAFMKEEEDALDITGELTEAVYQFAEAHYLISTGGTQLQNNLSETPMEIFQTLKDTQNMFVAPGDLLNHCENLKDIGVIK